MYGKLNKLKKKKTPTIKLIDFLSFVVRIPMKRSVALIPFNII